MIPGLWGAPLKAVSAFAPPMQTQDFNLYKNEVHAKFTDFDAGYGIRSPEQQTGHDRLHRIWLRKLP
mgnify:CR=1 FL=1